MYPRSSLSKTSLRLANQLESLTGIVNCEERMFDNIKDEPYIIQKGQTTATNLFSTLGPIKTNLVNTLSETYPHERWIWQHGCQS